MAAYIFNVLVSESNADFPGWILGVSASCFLTIAFSDPLSELTLHSHDRFKLTIALIAGTVLGFAIQAVWNTSTTARLKLLIWRL